MKKPQPIGLSRKGARDVDSIEQVSFRLPGRTKRQFASLLKEQGLEIKEVLVEFIERYIEFRGNIGVVPLDERDFASSEEASLPGKGAKKPDPSDLNSR